MKRHSNDDRRSIEPSHTPYHDQHHRGHFDLINRHQLSTIEAQLSHQTIALHRHPSPDLSLLLHLAQSRTSGTTPHLHLAIPAHSGSSKFRARIIGILVFTDACFCILFLPKRKPGITSTTGSLVPGLRAPQDPHARGRPASSHASPRQPSISMPSLIHLDER